MEYFNEYHTTILVVGLVGLLMYIQLVIADVVALVKKHVPGYPVENSHSELLFRVTRAYLNTNESVSIFIIFVCFALLSSAEPSVVNMSALAYLGSRVAHMVFYYLNIKLARSAVFGISLVSLLVMFAAGVSSWL